MTRCWPSAVTVCSKRDVMMMGRSLPLLSPVKVVLRGAERGSGDLVRRVEAGSPKSCSCTLDDGSPESASGSYSSSSESGSPILACVVGSDRNGSSEAGLRSDDASDDGVPTVRCEPPPPPPPPFSVRELLRRGPDGRSALVALVPPCSWCACGRGTRPRSSAPCWMPSRDRPSPAPTSRSSGKPSSTRMASAEPGGSERDCCERELVAPALPRLFVLDDGVLPDEGYMTLRMGK